MNDKEFNLQILAALIEYANELIATGRVTVEESGQYTAYNLTNGKNDMGERLHVDITGQNERKTLQVGGFSCTVTPYTMFGIIHKFEKICHVNNKNKTLFMFGDAQNNIFKERTMFIDGKGNVKTQNKTLRRQTEHTATDKYGSVYYQVTPSGVWYHVANDATPEMAEQFISIVFVRKGIERCKGSSFDPIYDALLAELEANEQTKEVVPTEKVEAIEVETKPIEQEKQKRTQGARFTFSMCGILPGEKIVFTPEQIEVTVADDTHVEFCGELFTLSGFCRAFMPDGKRKPSNAYQGPKYFTYGGVTLVRLRAEKTACVEVETKEVQTKENTVATPSYLAQERTEAHDLTTYHGEKNNGLKRMFVQQTNTSVLRIFNGFSTENLRKNTKCRKISSQKVVHTLPMPPPILPYLPCTSHTTVNKTITSKKSIIMEHSLKKELLQYFAAKDSRTEQEERLYKRMLTEVNHYDITSVEKSDLEERGYDTSELDEADMERIADEMCGYYLDSSTFSEDLYAAADELGIKRNDDNE